MSFSERDGELMRRALELAHKGLFTTTPNPRVGCVIVDRHGQIIGEGFHLRAGLGHAEVEALKQAGERARGASAYVTLEPCNHQGRTGACSEALLKAGIGEVVYAMRDPNPLVAGGGITRLEQAGVRVRGPLLESEARALNPGFIKRMTEGLPWVRCKMAMSLDGRTAMASGESQWITGPEARADVQYWRARSCAIVTGVGTLLSDDPALTVRDARFGERPRQPLRVIVDSQGRSPDSAQVFSVAGDTVVATAGQTTVGGARQTWPLPVSQGQVDLRALLQRLAEAQCNEVLIEAGPRLAGAFARQGLVDEFIIYMAPKLMGSSARPLFDWAISTMSEAAALEIESITPVGRDYCVRVRPVQVRPAQVRPTQAPGE